MNSSQSVNDSVCFQAPHWDDNVFTFPSISTVSWLWTRENIMSNHKVTLNHCVPSLYFTSCHESHRSRNREGRRRKCQWQKFRVGSKLFEKTIGTDEKKGVEWLSYLSS